MTTELPVRNGNGNGNGAGSAQTGNDEASFTVKTGLARMLQGGVIMDVVNAEQVRCFVGGSRLTIVREEKKRKKSSYLFVSVIGSHCRGSWSCGCHGFGARSGRHQSARRGSKDV